MRAQIGVIGNRLLRDSMTIQFPIPERDVNSNLRNHLSEYDFLILKKESGVHRTLRHIRSCIRKNCYRAGRGVKRICRKIAGRG